MAKQK